MPLSSPPSTLNGSAPSCNGLARPRYPRKKGTIARAGKYIHQYDESTLYCCRLASRVPQLASGSGTPSPRNERVISASTYGGMRIAACASSPREVWHKSCCHNEDRLRAHKD